VDVEVLKKTVATRPMPKVEVPEKYLRLARAMDEVRDALLAILTGHNVENGILSERLISMVAPPTQEAPERATADILKTARKDIAKAMPRTKDGFSPCERAILAVLARRFPKTSTSRQVAIMARYRQSGTFGAAITSLRQAGFLVGTRRDLVLTSDGRDVQPDIVLPKPGRELVAYWANELGSAAEGRIFQVVVNNYPAPIQKSSVASLLGYSQSGTFGAAITKLTTLELLERVPGGALRASRDLMGDT
jgi:hypothetical protein